ncbi:hypothetical protein J4771_06115 [Candidatus Kaistella beijingensis]|uniref:hypothetical protein n=1 Tax=Candidatus Kaistella beijingensis TaxID=2820270 RepID=UPI001CC5328D|nr:hypothetical protein [Candidatus Kaistella beijingensis]UBB90914.1 hypothetical protein J4771_06115 [Candidatus Kaistella beijingensis]
MSKRQSNTLKFRTASNVFNPAKSGFYKRRPNFIFTISEITNLYFRFTGFIEKLSPENKIKINEVLKSKEELDSFTNDLFLYVSSSMMSQTSVSLNEFIKHFINDYQENEEESCANEQLSDQQHVLQIAA